MDSDQAIEARLGCSIREFFEREGEDRFRDIEQEVIAQLCAQAPGVLATGGGVVLRLANRDALRAAGTVVYLQSQPEDLMRRLRHDHKRPLLQVADPTARLRELCAPKKPDVPSVPHICWMTARPPPCRVKNLHPGVLACTRCDCGRRVRRPPGDVPDDWRAAQRDERDARRRRCVLAGYIRQACSGTGRLALHETTRRQDADGDVHNEHSWHRSEGAHLPDQGRSAACFESMHERCTTFLCQMS